MRRDWWSREAGLQRGVLGITPRNRHCRSRVASLAEMSVNKAIHRAVRRDLSRFVDALREFPVGDPARAQQLATAWANFRHPADRAPHRRTPDRLARARGGRGRPRTDRSDGRGARPAGRGAEISGSCHRSPPSLRVSCRRDRRPGVVRETEYGRGRALRPRRGGARVGLSQQEGRPGDQDHGAPVRKRSARRPPEISSPGSPMAPQPTSSLPSSKTFPVRCWPSFVASSAGSTDATSPLSGIDVAVGFRSDRSPMRPSSPLRAGRGRDEPAYPEVHDRVTHASELETEELRDAPVHPLWSSGPRRDRFRLSAESIRMLEWVRRRAELLRGVRVAPRRGRWRCEAGR